MNILNTNNFEINALDEIRKQLGASPDYLKPQSIVRFNTNPNKKNKAGWAYYSDWIYNNKTYAICFFGDWSKHSDLQSLTYKSWTKEEEIQNPLLIKEHETQKTVAEEKRNEEAKELLKNIREKFKTFTPVLEDNYYIQKKKMKTIFGLFQDKNKNLIIPVYKDINKKEIFGYQTVNEQGKFFKTGSQAKFGFTFFGDINHTTSFIYLCEGIATAETIYQVTKTPTVSCFSASNIINVVKYFKENLSGINIVICADKDTNKVSIKYANRSKLKYNNIIVKIPNIKQGSELSDYNDIYLTEGFDEVKKQLEFNENEFVSVEFLGRDSSQYYFYSTRDKTIRSYNFEKIKSGQLSEIALESYWAQKFVPTLDKNGEPTLNCNWKLTSQIIAERQQKIGFYDQNKIKGVGSWIDNENIVLNFGDELLINGKTSNFGQHKNLKFFYTPSFKKLKYKKEPINDFTILKTAMDLVDFKSDRERILFLGYLAFAQIFTTQRWRPYLWIRADKGSGKSSLLGFLNKMIQNSTITQDSSSAGVRQFVASDSCVILVDEAEGEQYRTKQLLELARQSASDDNSLVFRGTSSGEAISFKPQISFAFASIRAPEMTAADESRMIEIFLQKSEKTSHEKNQKRISAFYDSEKLSVDLFSYMNNNIEAFDIARKQIHKELMTLGYDARFSDQYAPILSGYMCLYPETDLSEIVVKTLVNENQELQTETESDSDDFFETLMQIMLRVDNQDISLSYLLQKSASEYNDFYKRVLSDHGIYFLKDTFCFIKNNHMMNIVAKQSRYKNYWSAFKNNPNFLWQKVNKINGKPKRTAELIIKY